jgi:CheY-like chemotaxis protein
VNTKATNKKVIPCSLFGKTILIAEDDRPSQLLQKTVLERNGAKVIVTSNGREALDFCTSDVKVDLILMDIFMPKMDGITAASEIRKLPNRLAVPIIASTSKTLNNYEDPNLNINFNDYLQKPVCNETLMNSICKQLHLEKKVL